MEDGKMIFDHGRRKAPLITMFGGGVTTSRLRAERAISQAHPVLSDVAALGSPTRRCRAGTSIASKHRSMPPVSVGLF
ncbi:MAG: hypothetical protein ACREDL_16325 [Bradyrhizobium sp.]